jgi:hypothetical protein
MVPANSCTMRCLSEAGGMTEIEAATALGGAVACGVVRAWVRRLEAQGELDEDVVTYGSACSGGADTVAAGVAAELGDRFWYLFCAERNRKRRRALWRGWGEAGLEEWRCHADAREGAAVSESPVHFWALTANCNEYSGRNHHGSDDGARESLVDVYRCLDYVRTRTPGVVFVENVATQRVVGALSAMLGALTRYTWEMCVHDAINVGGGPSARRRCVWVGRVRPEHRWW